MRSLPLSQFFIGIFAFVVLVASVSQYGGISQYGAGFMPTILSALLLAFTVLDGVIQFRQQPRKIKFSSMEIRALLLVIVSIGLFIYLISYLGFLICASLMLFVLMCLRNPKKLVMNAVFSVVASGFIYYVFGRLLMVALPEGIWF
ncbi:tripartite tricarboxylate transporter TctB family protein [Vibrio sp. dsl-7]|uniref:Tripartite tricarboxylate transporter TctB family protein n=1 Tax=Vibrio chanodichtyis TaxID=3027932 RepID=A0ABT5V1N9_9VIBR|nr:tripartite tricarboxylate transporter TctB family protein [Vibrio chanodichtyis]MDE1515494.1 tripartite tricarboxylate transporter TctB family protein [Vibrio chanodichtyis]